MDVAIWVHHEDYLKFHKMYNTTALGQYIDVTADNLNSDDLDILRSIRWQYTKPPQRPPGSAKYIQCLIYCQAFVLLWDLCADSAPVAYIQDHGDEDDYDY